MTMEELSPALSIYLGGLVLAGLICLFLEFAKRPAKGGPEEVPTLEPWKIKGLDLFLIPVFVFLLINGVTALTIEAYKLIFKTSEIAEDHMFFLSFPMHITVLASLYGFYKYFSLEEDVPLNTVRYRPLTLLGKSGFYFLGIIPILYAVSFVWPFVLEFFKLPTNPQDLVDQVANMSWSPMFVLIAFLAVVVAPLSEELFFRAFLYRSLKTYMSPILAAILSSLLFTAMHGNWHSSLSLFLLGLWLCRSYEKSGNLWVPIILHALFNGNTLIILMLMGP